jgi:hypothetical protein
MLTAVEPAAGPAEKFFRIKDTTTRPQELKRKFKRSQGLARAA